MHAVVDTGQALPWDSCEACSLRVSTAHDKTDATQPLVTRTQKSTYTHIPEMTSKTKEVYINTASFYQMFCVIQWYSCVHLIRSLLLQILFPQLTLDFNKLVWDEVGELGQVRLRLVRATADVCANAAGPLPSTKEHTGSQQFLSAGTFAIHST